FYVRCRLDAGGYDAAPSLVAIVPNAVPAEQSLPARQTFVIAAGVIPGGAPPAPGQRARLLMTVDADGVVRALTVLGTGGAGAPELLVLDYTAPTATTPGTITLEAQLVGVG